MVVGRGSFPFAMVFFWDIRSILVVVRRGNKKTSEFQAVRNFRCLVSGFCLYLKSPSTIGKHVSEATARFHSSHCWPVLSSTIDLHAFNSHENIDHIFVLQATLLFTLLLMRSRARYGHFMIIHDLCDLVHLKKPPWRSDAFLKGLVGLESGL